MQQGATMGDWIENHIEWLLGGFFSLLATVAGLAGYITSINKRSKSNGIRIDEMGKEIKEISNKVNEVDKKTATYEEKLDTIIELLKK